MTTSTPSARRRRTPGGRQRSALALTLVLGGTGCALGFDWTPTGMRCDDQLGCLDGYSCLQSEWCIADRSVPPGGTCDKELQCPEHYSCVSGACRRRCVATLYEKGECSPGELCWPSQTVESAGVHACNPVTACSSDPDCDPTGSTGGICIQFSSTASLCMNGCDIGWKPDPLDPQSGTLVYDDPCPYQALVILQACQPTGDWGFQRLACIDAGTLQPGESCDTSSNTCMRGYGCVGLDRLCRRYCQDAADCGGGACNRYALNNGEVRACQ